MTPRVKPPHTLVSVLHWLWYCRAAALSARAHLTLLSGKNTLPFPAFGNLNFVSPPHRRAYTSMPKLCPNIRFPHQQDFFPIRSVTKSSTSRFSHENLVEKFQIFVQDFVPIRTALTLLIFLPSGTAPSDRDSNEDRHHDASDHHSHPPRGRNAPKRLPPRTASLASFPAKTTCSASTGNPSEDAAERERSRDGAAMRMDPLKDFRRRLLLV